MKKLEQIKTKYEEEVEEIKDDIIRIGSKINDLVDELATILPEDSEKQKEFFNALPADKMAYLKVVNSNVFIPIQS